MTTTKYYNSAQRKVIDFLIGFFGITALIVLAATLLISLTNGNPVAIAVVVILEIGAIITCFVKGRRFIAWGMLVALLLPLLVFGACLLVLSRS